MFQVMYMHEALCCILDRGRLCHRSSRLWEKGWLAVAVVLLSLPSQIG